MQNPINWFELPVVDLERATRFYEQVFACKLKADAGPDLALRIFPSNPAGVGGALVKDPRNQPAANGSIVYLNAGGILDQCLARVTAAGGKVLMPKTDIGEPGQIAIMLDTEGNRVGLHSGKRGEG